MLNAKFHSGCAFQQRHHQVSLCKCCTSRARQSGHCLQQQKIGESETGALGPAFARLIPLGTKGKASRSPLLGGFACGRRQVPVRIQCWIELAATDEVLQIADDGFARDAVFGGQVSDVGPGGCFA